MNMYHWVRHPVYEYYYAYHQYVNNILCIRALHLVDVVARTTTVSRSADNAWTGHQNSVHTATSLISSNSVYHYNTT